MSPLWRDEVGIFLSPATVVLVRRRRGLRPGPAATGRRAVSSDHPGAWQPALAVLGDVLAGTEWHDADAHVVLADAWVRYAAVPRVEALTRAAERRAHAGHVMEQLFGDSVRGWRLALSRAAPGSPGVACAVAPELLDGVRAVTAAARLRVRSLQPQLIAAYNHWRQALPDEDCWFVSMDGGTLAAAQLAAGGWSEVRSVRIGTDWDVELRRLRTFGRLAAGNDGSSRVFVDAPAMACDAADDADDGLRILRAGTAAGVGTLGQLLSERGAPP